jgi:cytoskeletal protein CcmA (bactofilin family)
MGVGDMRITDPSVGGGHRPFPSDSPVGGVKAVDQTAGSSGLSMLPSWIEERLRVAVNRNVNVAGRLVFNEPIRIEGHFRGEVSSNELVVISEDGSVGGRVRSPRLVVLGQLEGDITTSHSVVLGPRSRFKGKIEADNLTVYEGAHLNGDLRIGSVASGKPLTVAPSTTAAARNFGAMGVRPAAMGRGPLIRDDNKREPDGN